MSEELIRKALHPYPADLVIATKAGMLRPGPAAWHLANRGAEDVLDCQAERLGFIPWFPLATAQLAIAWLLHRSPVMLPIPGTSAEFQAVIQAG